MQIALLGECGFAQSWPDLVRNISGDFWRAKRAIHHGQLVDAPKYYVRMLGLDQQDASQVGAHGDAFRTPHRPLCPKCEDYKPYGL